MKRASNSTNHYTAECPTKDTDYSSQQVEYKNIMFLA